MSEQKELEYRLSKPQQTMVRALGREQERIRGEMVEVDEAIQAMANSIYPGPGSKVFELRQDGTMVLLVTPGSGE